MQYLRSFNKRRYFILSIGIFILLSVFFFQFIYSNTLELEERLVNIEGTVRSLDDLETNDGYSYTVSINDVHSIIRTLNFIIISIMMYLILSVVFSIYVTYYLLREYKRIRNIKHDRKQ
jgi:ABC-type antimicrobial peptide transport system permease subunit